MARRTQTCFLLVLSYLSLATFSKAAAFDYFTLVLQWPPATCNRARLPQPCPTPIPKRFTIHGLWLKFNNGSSLANCAGPEFDSTKIQGIRGVLNIQWPNVQQRDGNEIFWKQEWEKHGTCWQPNEQLKYFQKALDLKQKNDLLKILEGAGFGPSEKNRYLEQIKAAIKKKVKGGVDPALRCFQSKNGGMQLNEIVLCYKNDAVTPTNCPPTITNCPEQFLWLPKNSSALPIEEFAKDETDDLTSWYDLAADE